MKPVRFLFLFLLPLAACEDPSNVGLGLLEGEGGAPVVVTVSPSSLVNTPVPDITGNNPGPQRALAGRVEDPILGTFSATAYVDFQTPALITDGFRNGPVTSASLILARDYRYGDTTSTVRLALHDMPEEWEAANARADSVLPFEAATILEAALAPEDATTRIDLPETWLSAHDTELRSETFPTDFHGFALTPVDGNTVLGFTTVSTLLRVISNGDTTFFPVSKTVSSLTGDGVRQLPPDRILVQDGAGPGVDIRFDFKAEGVSLTALNRVVFSLTADTLFLAEDAPPHFLRPVERRFSLSGVTPSGLSLPIEEATLAEDGTLTFQSQQLFNVFQSMLLEEDVFDRFRLSVPAGDNTLNPVVFFTDPPEPPEATLTLTPVAN